MTDPIQKFALTLGDGARTKEYLGVEWSLDELESYLGQHAAQRQKDGKFFVPGTLVEGTRKKNAISTISCLVYDIDGTNSIKDVDKKLDDAGYRAFLYTTYSHGTAVTIVKPKAYEAWAKKANQSKRPNVESMKRYLDSINKGYLTNIKCDGKTTHAKDGVVYVVPHDPVDKMRVVFPLEKPIVLSELSAVTEQMINIYKSIYHGVGNTLGIKFDAACSDPSRLHYIPARPVAKKEDGVDFLRYQYPGRLLDYTKFERAVIKSSGTKTNSDGTERKVSATDYVVFDKDDRYIDLQAWDNKHYATFDIEETLEHALPEGMIRDQRSSGGFHIECPFEDGHTNPGGQGTFVANGDGAEQGWVIFCSHNSCKEIEGRGKLDYLKKLIQDGCVTALDLGYAAPEAAAPSAPAPPSITPEVSALGIDPETLPTISTEEFNSATLEAKNFNSKTEALAAGSALIESATFVGQVAQGLKYFEDSGIELDGAKLVELVGVSSCSVHSIADYIKKHKNTLGGMNGPEFGTALREYRAQAVSIVAKLGDIFNDQKSGLELEHELRRVSQWYGTPLTDLKAQFNALRRENDVLLLDETIVLQMDQLEKQYAKLTLGPAAYWLDEPATQVSDTGKEVRYSPQTMSTMKKNNNAIIGTEKKPKTINIWETFVEHRKTIREYRGITFDPCRNPGEQRNGEAYNLWNGFRIKPRKGDIEPLQEHLLNIWCRGDVEVHNWIQMYFADIIQHPGEKPQSTICILGGAGTGKSMILDAFCRIVKPWSFTTARAEDIVGKFNSQIANKLVVVSEEAIFSGNKLAMARLKQTISGKTTPMEAKGVDTADVPNFTRFFFISNERHALHLDDDDRRFLVIRTAPKRSEEYYSKFAAWLKDDRNLAAWVHYLKTFKPEDHGLTWNKLHYPPMTDDKIEQIEQSSDASVQFFLDLLETGRLSRLPNTIDLPMKMCWPLDEPWVADTALFRQAFDTFVNHFAGRPEFERSKYSPTAKLFFGALTQYRSTVRDPADKTLINHAYRFPSRRAMIAEAMRLKSPVRQSLLESAIENPNSHLPQFNED